MNILNAIKTIFSTERQASYASSTNGVPTVVIDGTNNGQGDGCMKFSTLASVLGGIKNGLWEGGSFANMMRENRQCCYYVDKEYNGAQSDMPYDYCVISINFSPYGSNNDVQMMALAFNIVNGECKMKVVSGIGSSRDFPWKVIALDFPAYLKTYNSISQLAAGTNSANSNFQFNYSSESRLVDTREAAINVLSYVASNAGLPSQVFFSGIVNGQRADYFVWGYVYGNYQYGMINVQEYEGENDFFTVIGGTVSATNSYSFNVPSFYKDYGTILAFAGGLVTYGALNIDTFTGLFASTKNMAAEWSPAASLPGVNQTTYAILLNIGCCQMAYLFDDMALYARPNFGSSFGAWSKVN